MKLTHLNFFKYAQMGIIGIAFAQSVAQSVHAAVVHTVVDPSFGAAVAGGGTFSYASTAAWKNNNAVDDSWFYNSSYQAKRPTPRTGDVALHGGAGYTAQLLADTFVAGRTYTFTIHLTGDADATGITDRTWMYLYDGTAIPDATLFTEGSELVRARYLDDGTNDSFNSPTGTGATSGTNSGWSRGSDPTDWSLGGGTWGTASISYTATATDDGKQIGIALWGAGDTAWDDASVTSVPEPTSAALLGLGGLALILRRKK